MYEELIERWRNYQQAMYSKPYDGDRVQGTGMAFADEWNRLKPNICEDYKIPINEFSYAMKMDIMPKIMVDTFWRA